MDSAKPSHKPTADVPTASALSSALEALRDLTVMKSLPWVVNLTALALVMTPEQIAALERDPNWVVQRKLPPTRTV